MAKEMKRIKHFIRIGLFWLGLSVFIGGVTVVSCGSFQPIINDSGSPDYNCAQWILFFITKIYSWPVTTFFVGLDKIAPFDVFVSPFLLEVADLKIGLGVIVFYVVFYSSITILAMKLITKLRSKED